MQKNDEGVALCPSRHVRRATTDVADDTAARLLFVGGGGGGRGVFSLYELLYSLFPFLLPFTFYRGSSRVIARILRGALLSAFLSVGSCHLPSLAISLSISSSRRLISFSSRDMSVARIIMSAMAL